MATKSASGVICDKCGRFSVSKKGGRPDDMAKVFLSVDKFDPDEGWVSENVGPADVCTDCLDGIVAKGLQVLTGKK